jgi:hypothetical protein
LGRVIPLFAKQKGKQAHSGEEAEGIDSLSNNLLPGLTHSCASHINPFISGLLKEFTLHTITMAVKFQHKLCRGYSNSSRLWVSKFLFFSINFVYIKLLYLWSFINILFSYISFGGVHCDISIYAYNIPWLDSPPPSFSLIFLPTAFLKTISTGFFVISSYEYINYKDHIHPHHSPFPFH